MTKTARHASATASADCRMPHFGPVRTVWDFPGGISRFASSICPHPPCVLTAESAFAACAALRSAGKCRVFRRSASPERARKPKSALPAPSIGGHPIDALNAGSARSFARRGRSACVIKGAMSSTCSTTIQSPRSFSLRLLCEWRFPKSSACPPAWMCRARSSVL